MSASPPSDVIRQLLIDLSLGTEEDSWPIYISFLPATPDEAICVYDTVGVLDGRVMSSGEQIEHPGIQIVVRGPDYLQTHYKATQIARSLDEQRRVLVAISSDEAYVVHNVSRTSPIQSLGVEEEGDRRRHVFTVNATLTMTLQ